MEGATLTERSIEVIPSVSVAKKFEDASEIFSFNLIQHVVELAWSRSAQLVDYKLESYSNEKLGFLGSHCCLVITVKCDNAIESRNFFTKIIPPKTDLMGDVIFLMGVFRREGHFYNEIWPLLNEGYDTEPWSAQCYFASKDVIILEDLRVKGFKMHNKTFDKTEIMSALSAIARMHAASLSTEQRLGKTLLEVCPGAFDMDLYNNENTFWKKWFRTGIKTTISLFDHYGMDSSRVSEIAEKVLSSAGPSPTKHNAVSHSDLWTNNMMLDESLPPKCVLFDFQLMTYRPMGWDFNMMLYLCADREFRNQYKVEMMMYYYSILRENIINCGSRNVVPEWSEFVQSVEEYTLNALVFAVFYFPSSLLDGKTCEAMFQNPEGFKEFMYTDRYRITLAHMKKNSYYRKRIEEVLKELDELLQKYDTLQFPS